MEYMNIPLSFDTRVAVFIYLPSIYFFTASLRDGENVIIRTTGTDSNAGGKTFDRSPEPEKIRVPLVDMVSTLTYHEASSSVLSPLEHRLLVVSEYFIDNSYGGFQIRLAAEDSGTTYRLSTAASNSLRAPRKLHDSFRGTMLPPLRARGFELGFRLQGNTENPPAPSKEVFR
ncbi:hypothetical protein CPB85DRAFT_1260778 [Mucidula mucida]|nr:hypothetical protein CPB85DRAFT_1260778 [Mucidula mucida]